MCFRFQIRLAKKKKKKKKKKKSKRNRAFRILFPYVETKKIVCNFIEAILELRYCMYIYVQRKLIVSSLFMTATMLIGLH